MSRFARLASVLSAALIAVAAAVPCVGQEQPKTELPRTEQPKTDPMRPYRPQLPVRPDGTVPRKYELSAVLISATRRIAVINGGLYREGDEVEGATITRIEAGSVSLRRGSERLVVPLNAAQPATTDIHGDSAS